MVKIPTTIKNKKRERKSTQSQQKWGLGVTENAKKTAKNDKN